MLIGILLALLVAGIVGVWLYDATVLEGMRLQVQMQQWDTLARAEGNDGWMIVLVLVLVVTNLVLGYLVVQRRRESEEQQVMPVRRRRTASAPAQIAAPQPPQLPQGADAFQAFLWMEMMDRAEARRRRLPGRVDVYDEEDR